MNVPANSPVGAPSRKSHAIASLIITFVLILLFTVSPFIVSLGGGGLASVLGCDGSMEISSPCTLMGSDVSRTLTTMIYLGYLGFVTIPVGEFLLIVWVVVACVVALVRWCRRRVAV